MTAQNKMQSPNPRSYSQSDPSQTQGAAHELEPPPPSYEAAVLGTDDRNQGRRGQSHNVNEPAGEIHFWNQPEGLREQLEQQRQQLEQQLEQQRQQREVQRQQLEQQLEQQRQQREVQRQQLQLQLQQQQQQQPYPIQEYSSPNHGYQPDTKHFNTSQQDDYDVEAQQPTLASSSRIHTSSSGQAQTDPRNGRGHGRGACQQQDGKQRSGNCCVACFGGCLAGCAACCYCCVVM